MNIKDLKIGDVINHRLISEPLTVRCISKTEIVVSDSDNEFEVFSAGPDGGFIALEFYQDRKKLYAYENNQHIIFSKLDHGEKAEIRQAIYIRTPEFDIEYE